MGSNSFHFLKSPAMVASLSLVLLILLLLIIIVILIRCCSISSAAFMTLLSMFVSAFFTFIFSKNKQSIDESQPEESSEIKNFAASDQKVALNSDCPVSEDLNLFRSSQGSQDSISDDESLIEIDLPDGHFNDSSETSSEALQLGLMELLSEINDEDSLIEIDIAMGSIKCPRLEVKA